MFKSYQYILYEKIGSLARITINRPEKRNALHPAASLEMLEAFTDFRDNAGLLVAIVTGTGDQAFCAGDDLSHMVQHRKPGEPYPDWDLYPLGAITSKFVCWKPIIAAVNGFALGGGFELALACDIIVAAEHSEFGLPEPTIGVVAGAGGPHRLARQLPLKIAMGMLLTGKRLGAQEAHELGLVNEVVPGGQLMQVAERWAKDILKCAPNAVRATKQMALMGLGQSLENAIRNSYSEYEKALNSEDYFEGPRAFVEKRTPKWE